MEVVTELAARAAALAAQPSSPVIVKIVEPRKTGLSDVLLGALGLTGVLLLGAVILGLALAGVMFLLRSRNPLSH